MCVVFPLIFQLDPRRQQWGEWRLGLGVLQHTIYFAMALDHRSSVAAPRSIIDHRPSPCICVYMCIYIYIYVVISKIDANIHSSITHQGHEDLCCVLMGPPQDYPRPTQDHPQTTHRKSVCLDGSAPRSPKTDPRSPPDHPLEKC